MTAGRVDDKPYLLNQGFGRSQLSCKDPGDDGGTQGERQYAQRAGLADQFDLPRRQSVPGLVVPQFQGRRLREPEPAKPAVGGEVAVPERLYSLSEQRG